MLGRSGIHATAVLTRFLLSSFCSPCRALLLLVHRDCGRQRSPRFARGNTSPSCPVFSASLLSRCFVFVGAARRSVLQWHNELRFTVRFGQTSCASPMQPGRAVCIPTGWLSSHLHLRVSPPRRESRSPPATAHNLRDISSQSLVVACDDRTGVRRPACADMLMS
jgi:hypothetical protein